MTYWEERVDILKKSRFSSYPYPKAPVIEPLWELCKLVHDKVYPSGFSENATFIYYEKTAGKNRILGFRMPETGSYLIYRCTVDCRNKKPKYLVKVVGLEGEEAMAYFEASARAIIPFFREAESCYVEDTSKISSINLINMRTGAYYRRDVPVDLLEEEMAVIESEIGVKSFG